MLLGWIFCQCSMLFWLPHIGVERQDWILHVTSLHGEVMELLFLVRSLQPACLFLFLL
jgi:hypothetical protein